MALSFFTIGHSTRPPFGALVAPNITPDRDTSIGNWTKDEFIAALHDGRGTTVRASIRQCPIHLTPR